MKRRRPPLPSPALVIACLALFVALGGTVLAATKTNGHKINGHKIRVKSLPGNRLVVGSLPGNRLKPGTLGGGRVKPGTLPGDRVKPGTLPGDRLTPGSVPGDRLEPGSVKGEQVDVGTLGKVPDAAHADAADTARHAETATAADHAADATTVNGHAVGCAPGRRQFGGACWDLQVSLVATTAIEAAAACGAAGGELPDLLALMAFDRLPGVPLSLEGEWTTAYHLLGDDIYSIGVLVGGSHVSLVSPTAHSHFRCVTPLLA